eukprot:CAMPEP_0197897558 /NCGR_PEP_ID=MMETSP1439-20131203/42248_1 /TAXON_ID=66791 /ORGANISM="Gonyaulax spinifera, Strain CCMP409" /LENGTH=103 /DNA_ID=CAMNT_0043518195 /DNA_START=149 /DNA_END=460 /DNA_ORIENTATION=-
MGADVVDEGTGHRCTLELADAWDEDLASPGNQPPSPTPIIDCGLGPFSSTSPWEPRAAQIAARSLDKDKQPPGRSDRCCGVVSQRERRCELPAMRDCLGGLSV